MVNLSKRFAVLTKDLLMKALAIVRVEFFLHARCS